MQGGAMRAIGFILLVGAATAQAPSFQPVGTVSQLMVNIIYPTSDAIFYIERTPPKTDVEWNTIRNQALMLAESGNLLMMPSRVRDQGNWIKDSKMLVDVGAAAYKAALAKDMDGIVALNQQLNDACVVCHQQYRRGYGKRRSL
jgi:cytochrome c556